VCKDVHKAAISQSVEMVNAAPTQRKIWKMFNGFLLIYLYTSPVPYNRPVLYPNSISMKI